MKGKGKGKGKGNWASLFARVIKCGCSECEEARDRHATPEEVRRLLAKTERGRELLTGGGE